MIFLEIISLRYVGPLAPLLKEIDLILKSIRLKVTRSKNLFDKTYFMEDLCLD